MSLISITHSAAEGTVVTGTAKADGTAPVLKRHGFRWSRTLGAWYLPHSRDKRADVGRMNALAAELHDVPAVVAEIEVDDTPRPVAEREADRAQRRAARAEGLDAKAARLGAQAATAHDQAHRMADAIPFGQPILVGHHSEGRDRNYRARMSAAMDKAVDLGGEAEETTRRAQASKGAEAQRLDAPQTLRRIKALEERRRANDRHLEELGDREAVATMGLAPPPAAGAVRFWHRDNAEVDEALEYWRAHLAALEAAGAKLWGPADFRKGDRVNGDCTVVRVNQKSLTVARDVFGGMTGGLPYDKVRSMERPEGGT